MKFRLLTLLTAIAFAVPLWAAPISGFQSYTPVLTGGTVADFEGFTEFQRISTQAALGMTFSQTGGGLPMIDNSTKTAVALDAAAHPGVSAMVRARARAS